jgi:hypothetical protein
MVNTDMKRATFWRSIYAQELPKDKTLRKIAVGIAITAIVALSALVLYTTHENRQFCLEHYPSAICNI